MYNCGIINPAIKLSIYPFKAPQLHAVLRPRKVNQVEPDKLQTKAIYGTRKIRENFSL